MSLQQNKSKVAAIVVITAFLGWFCYRFFNRPNLNPQAPSLALDWKELETAPQEPQTLKETIVTKDGAPKMRIREEITPSEEEKFQAFDEMEKLWLGKVKSILSAEQFTIYEDMREQNEKEKLVAYKQFHDYLRQKHGDQFSYKISEDQSAAEKKINERYLKELLGIIGNEKFTQYLKARDEVNEVFRRKNKPFIQVEF